MAEKINEKYYIQLRKSMFMIIKMICKSLPCPKCAFEASNYLDRLNIEHYKTKTEFKNMLYLMHNWVNKKKKKPLFNYENINKYSELNIYLAFNNFVRVYHTRGNMSLIADSFRRGMTVREVKKWVKMNGRGFNSKN
jgi:hypothetical protein